MSGPERAPSGEKRSTFFKNLGKIALFAFGLAIGAEAANLLHDTHVPKIK